jgi:glycosyltransferase involved in cell wall biosynthesis
MALFSILPAWILAKIYKAKLIYEVKDICPLSLVELGGFKSTHPFIRLMAWFEKFALKKSDVIVSNLQNYGEHIKKDIGLNRNFEWISNGVVLDGLSKIEPLDEKIITKIPKDKFIVGYTGTIGVANAMESFCQSAIKLQDKNDILFVIVGDGKEKQKLFEEYNNLDNILFIDSIPKKQIQSMLKLFDVCYIGLQKENLFKYGVSPNKLFDYMYSGKPIIYAIDSGESNIVKLSNCGLSVEAINPIAIAKGIMDVYNMSQDERDTLGANGKKYVLEHFTYEKLAHKYKELL